MKSALFDRVGHLVVDVSDVTGDGHADLVTASSDGNVYVYRGQLGGTFSSGVPSFAGTYPVSTTAREGSGSDRGSRRQRRRLC